MKRALVGLIGASIGKSLSPILHEDAFAAAGIRGHYHLMDLDRLSGRTLADLLDAACALGFAGLNVTYPCKEAVVPLLREIRSEAAEIGSVNTVTIDPRGRTTGHNTDRVGFRRSLEDALGHEAVRGATVVLLGAGGAGRAVAFALFDLGAARLCIHDTVAAKSAALATHLVTRFGAGRAASVEAPEPALDAAAGLVNATPVGMHGFAGMPVSPDAIRPGHWVADIVYTPLETALIAATKARGGRAVNGGGMCVHQAAEAFRLFTGLAPDVERMKRVFAEAVTARDRALLATA